MKFEPTRPPNFLTIEGGTNNDKVDLGHLSEEEFKDFSDKMTKRLEEHWKKRKKKLIEWKANQ